MKLHREPPLPGALIALTPLIDIVFILLIFFMLASRFDLWGGLQVGLSAAAASGAGAALAEEEDRPVVLVRVGAGEGVQIGGRTLSLLQLRQLVAEGLERPVGRRPAYAVRAEPGAAVQRLVAVLEALRAAGADEIGLVPAEPAGR